MKWLSLALLGAIAACASQPAPAPRAEGSGIGSPSNDFSKYQSFTFGPANAPEAGYATTPRSLEVQRKLAPLVEASLQGRGYQRGDENADLVIKISTGSGTLPGDQYQRDTVKEAPAGFIGVDAYDRTTGASVWHGAAHAEVDPEHIDDTLLAKGVESMLASFPTRKQ